MVAVQELLSTRTPLNSSCATHEKGGVVFEALGLWSSVGVSNELRIFSC